MTAMCERCGKVYELEITTLPVKHKYCDICRQSIKAENNLQSTRKKRAAERRKIVVREEHKVIPNKKHMSRLLADNMDWLNAGSYCGKQGELRERFQELVDKYDDFLLAKAEIELHPKWIAELKGSNESERCAWLIGFFSAFNHP